MSVIILQVRRSFIVSSTVEKMERERVMSSLPQSKCDNCLEWVEYESKHTCKEVA